MEILNEWIYCELYVRFNSKWLAFVIPMQLPLTVSEIAAVSDSTTLPRRAKPLGYFHAPWFRRPKLTENGPRRKALHGQPGQIVSAQLIEARSTKGAGWVAFACPHGVALSEGNIAAICKAAVNDRPTELDAGKAVEWIMKSGVVLECLIQKAVPGTRLLGVFSMPLRYRSVIAE